MKGKINFIIDVVMFALMALLAGIGLLIKYVLLSGTERWLKYDRNVELTFWGMDRHQWGAIHLWIAVALIALLVLHIILHWKMIICLYKKIVENRKGRIICGIALFVITILFVVFPFFIQVEISEMQSGRERFQSESLVQNLPVHKGKNKAEGLNESRTDESNDTITNSAEEKQLVETEESEEHDGHHHHIDESIEVKGYNTLQEISDLYGIPCDVLKEKMNIPSGVSNTYKLGHLRKEYGIKMSDVELIIHNYLKNNSK
ncbi:MAG TPA: DUF4405 domain-containing protein [Bacteroidales bacterium]|nr:DUF4405 domain-containing protein [Bacteroidales bacterium]